MKKPVKPMKKNIGIATKKRPPQKLKAGGEVKKKPQYT
jgi:hypothetical protein